MHALRSAAAGDADAVGPWAPVLVAGILLAAGGITGAVGGGTLVPATLGVVALLGVVVALVRAGRTRAAAVAAAAGLALAGVVPVLATGEVRTWPLYVLLSAATLMLVVPLRAFPAVAGAGVALLGVMALGARDLAAPAASAGELLAESALLLLSLTAVGALGVATLRASRRREASARARARQLGELAYRDPLTGLHNRRFADAVLPKLLAAATRQGSPLAVAVLDVDHFKAVNDRLGHAAGDALLAEVGHVLRACSREMDVAVRWGGDEFVLVMPATTAEQAAAVCGRVHRRIRGTDWEAVLDAPARPTLSAGVAATTTAADPAVLLAVADARLLAAKTAGRNRTAAFA